MSAEFFIDTNILIYTFDTDHSTKQMRAQELAEMALQTSVGIVSYQVVQEFLNVATHKFATPMTPDDALRYLRGVLEPLCMVFPSITLYERAIDLQERWRYGFYDALIIGSALQAGCEILYSNTAKR